MPRAPSAHTCCASPSSWPHHALPAEEVPFSARPRREASGTSLARPEVPQTAAHAWRCGAVGLLLLSSEARSPNAAVCHFRRTRRSVARGTDRLASTLGEFLDAAGTGRPLQELESAAPGPRILGADHPSTPRVRPGADFARRGDLAVSLFARAGSALRVLRPDHVDTLSALNNLAQAVTQRGDLARAQSRAECSMRSTCAGRRPSIR